MIASADCGVILFTTSRTSEFAKSFSYVILRLVISILLTLYVYDRNFAFHCSEGLESKLVMETNGSSVLMIRVNSRSKLAADRDGISALYRCNLLLLRRWWLYVVEEVWCILPKKI